MTTLISIKQYLFFWCILILIKYSVLIGCENAYCDEIQISSRKPLRNDYNSLERIGNVEQYPLKEQPYSRPFPVQRRDISLVTLSEISDTIARTCWKYTILSVSYRWSITRNSEIVCYDLRERISTEKTLNILIKRISRIKEILNLLFPGTYVITTSIHFDQAWIKLVQTAVEIFTNNPLFMQENVAVKTLIGDEDSRTIASVRRAASFEVEKWSDYNHIKKSFTSSLYTMKLSPVLIDYFGKNFAIAIERNKGDAVKVEQSLQAVVPHAYGDHTLCGDWCKGTVNEDYVHKNLPQGKPLTDPDLKI
ncbi:uncharacterized protein [Temnothorax longispinosus]|uniref:uncharacterized protein isoform X2 n=1 Tax=Temnothorax longispinosus TaxID=300112 RepID=UPI003A99BA59